MSVEPLVLKDAEARERIEHELETSFVVEAAAGSGKTTLLVRRLRALLVERGVPLRRILATTFTDRAAGEITLRLRAGLEELRHVPDEKRRAAAERALLEMEEAKIGTIHSIAGELLREVPLEAGLDPDFVVLGQEEARLLRERVIRAHLEELLVEPPEGMRRWLRRKRNPNDGPVIQQLTSALDALSDQRDLKTPWARPASFSRAAAIDGVIAELGALLAAAKNEGVGRDGLAEAFRELQRLHGRLTEGEPVAPRDHDALEALLSALTQKDFDAVEKSGRSKDPRIAALRERRDAWLNGLGVLRENLNADLAALVRADLWPALTRYEEAKRKEGALDFHDLIRVLRDTLVAKPEVRRIFASRFDHLLVDEVQDTDPLQLEIIRLLAAADPTVAEPELAAPGPGKLFVVGDPKQSIYAFRGSSVDAYLRFRDRLVAEGVVRLDLTTTFRCAPSIAKVVDRACATLFQPGPYQAAYAGLSPVRPEPTSRPSVIALPVPRPYGYGGQVYRNGVRAQMPELIASMIDFLVNQSGWRITDPKGGPDVPLRPRHIALLGKHFTSWGNDNVGPVARALSRRGVPHAHIGGKSFHATEEIAALRAVARAIEWPDDELAVYATLRGPFVAHSDADLFSYQALLGRLDPQRVPRDPSVLSEVQRPIAESLAFLGELHQHRARRSIPETLTRFLTRCGVWLSLAAAGDGDLLLARAQRWLELAAEREARGALSFRRFVEALDGAAARGEDVTVPPPDGLDAVRFSTVHQAKGLEFPVVMLLDPMTAPERPAKVVDLSRGLYVDRLLNLEPLEHARYRDEAAARGTAEGARVLYVAATRARDLLIVPVIGQGTIGGWLSPLEEALHPAAPRAARPAPGCPAFGARTLLDDPGGEPSAREVAPGLHLIGPSSQGDAEARVVFWDPELLTRGTSAAPAVRHHEMFSEVTGDVLAATRREHEGFLVARDAWKAGASSMEILPLRDVLLDAGLASAAEALEPETFALELSEEVPRSDRLDRILDAALQQYGAPSSARTSAPERARTRLARVALELGAPELERASVERVLAALEAHPDLGAILSALEARSVCGAVGTRILEGTLLVSAPLAELGGAVALAVHAASESEEVAKLRLALASLLHQRATGQPVRPVLVTLGELG